MFTLNDIAEMASCEMQALKRWDEEVCIDLDERIEDYIDGAQTIASTCDCESPTEEQKHRFRKLMRRWYKDIGGIYMPKVDAEISAKITRQHKYREKFGTALAIYLTYKRIEYSDRILYFLALPVSKVWDLYHKKKFLREKDVVTFLQREIRWLIGHERRHKIQYNLYAESTIYLWCNGPDTPVQLAKEQDANWWARCFNEFHFGDQVAEL